MSKQLYMNGPILTMEQEDPAEALLIADGYIECVGSLEHVKQSADETTEYIDLNGNTLMPSFIDAHSHFTGYATSLLQPSLAEASSFEEISGILQTFARKNVVSPGTWIIARNYDQNNLIEKSHPKIALLDQIFPENPCVLQHQSGHMGVFNTLALEALQCNPSAFPNGYMEENQYMNYITQVPMPGMNEIIQAIKKAQQIYASYGITTVQEGFVVKELADLLLLFQQQNLMILDLIGYLDVQHEKELMARFSGCLKQYQNHIKIGGYKTFLDGSPQSRTAWMKTPYQNTNGQEFGVSSSSDEKLYTTMETACQNKMQLLCHCNGDAACEQFLTQFEKLSMKYPDASKLRPVLIHAQFLAKEQLNRVKKLGIIPSFFVAHTFYFGDIHIQNVGLERASSISCANSALQEGILFTFHQDAPVIEPDMLETVWCSVNRQTKSGVILGAKEAIPVYEALKAVTIHAAYEYFEEKEKGTLTKGKKADFILLSANPLQVAKEQIKDIQVLRTYKDGICIWSK